MSNDSEEGGRYSDLWKDMSRCSLDGGLYFDLQEPILEDSQEAGR